MLCKMFWSKLGTKMAPGDSCDNVYNSIMESRCVGSK